MEREFPARTDRAAALRVGLLGSPLVLRGGKPVDRPASRKVLMLLGYLALATRPVSRSHLCDLLWDGPNDPRGELRWCLSKLRRLLQEEGEVRIEAHGDQVSLSLAPDEADVLAVQEATNAGLDTLGEAELTALAGRFAGPFLDGLAPERSPVFEAWLASRRRHFRTIHLTVLERLCALPTVGSEARLAALEQRAALCPDDVPAQVALLAELASRRSFAAAEAHLAATIRIFDADGLDPAPLRAAWRDLREKARSEERTPTEADAAPAWASPAGVEPPRASPPSPEARRRPRVAFLPPAADDAGASGLADALTHDVIARLARLRSLAVIAWGSVQALARKALSPEEAAAALRADYLASGTLRTWGERQRLTIEVMDVSSQAVLWSEAYDVSRGDGLLLNEEIGRAIVASLTHAVELAERDRALVKPPGSLNAWETYHRGLWHMYQFTRSENRLAQDHFRDASLLDPTFARAFAGLSFTHWQNAFQRWGDRDEETVASHAAASRSVLVDDLDPTAHWAMGRALWLRGSVDESLAELRRAVDLSPSFALGHYAIAFVQSQSGDPAEAIGAAEQARDLSPFDPMLFGTYGALAMAHARKEAFQDAARWGLLAAAQPNAHKIILAIAAHCLVLAGRTEEARGFAARLRSVDPGYTTETFVSAFQFSPDARRLFLLAGRRLGLD
ncbi:MAG: transcriptional regulator [Alsobacter sp.]